MSLSTVTYIQACISYALICCLVCLIFTSTTRQMRNYGALIFNALLCDLIISIADPLSLSEFISLRTGFVVTYSGRCFSVGPSFCYYCFAFLFLSYYQLVNLNLFSFFVRYRALQSDPLNFKSVVAVCAGLWISIIVTTISCLPICFGDQVAVFNEVNELYPVNEYLTMHGFGAFGDERQTLARYRMHLWIGSSFVCTSCSIWGIIFLRMRINTLFDTRKVHLSAATIRTHKSLMLVFTIQTVVPFVLWALVSLIAVHMFVEPILFIERYLFAVIGCFPIFNTTVNIVFVYPYRMALLYIFPCTRKMITEKSTSITN